MIMTTIAENLQTIKDSTDAIKQAIIDKGGAIEGDITTWASAISELSGGTEEVQPTANLILNKLNGATIGDPTTVYDLETVLHTYTFDNSSTNVVNAALITNNFWKLFLTAEWPSSSNRFGPPNQIEMAFSGYLDYDYDDSNKVTLLKLDLAVSHLGSDLTQSVETIDFIIIAFGEDGTFDFDKGVLNIAVCSCYVKDTNISLSNGSTKKVQDINYNDELLVWNFDEGKFDKAKPLWIKKEERTNNYYKVTLDNGNTIGLVGSNGKCHRLFNHDDMIFESATELVGKNIHTLNGIHKVISVENIKEIVEYYNIITDFHMNCFANGMLTSCRYNNLYPIKNMVFDKSQINVEPKWKVNQKKFIPNPEILPKYINGMRLTENTTMTINEMKEYAVNLENKRKTILDFNSEGILNNIGDTEVGWIDREGKVYGFRLYISGQQSHKILADKICKELDIEMDNPSGHLEKEGWVKYNTDFVLNSDDKEINDKQLKSLRKFLKTPNKLKKEGKIRIGNFMSPHVDISDFETMDTYSFEYRKKHNIGGNKWQQEI